MITRKAVIGFILLALLVFPAAYLSWVAPMPVTSVSVDFSQYQYRDDSVAKTYTYTTPKVQFASPLEMAVTGIMEVFTLVCYLIMKRIEPFYAEWERAERERMKTKSQ